MDAHGCFRRVSLCLPLKLREPWPCSRGTLPGLPPSFSQDPLLPGQGGSAPVAKPAFPGAEAGNKDILLKASPRGTRPPSAVPAEGAQRRGSSRPRKRNRTGTGVPAARGLLPQEGTGLPLPPPQRGPGTGQPFTDPSGSLAGRQAPGPLPHSAPWCQPRASSSAAAVRSPGKARKMPRLGDGREPQNGVCPLFLAKNAKKGEARRLPAPPSSVPAPSSRSLPPSPALPASRTGRLRGVPLGDLREQPAQGQAGSEPPRLLRLHFCPKVQGKGKGSENCDRKKTSQQNGPE